MYQHFCTGPGTQFSKGVIPGPGFQRTNGPFIQEGGLRPLLPEKEEEASQTLSRGSRECGLEEAYTQRSPQVSHRKADGGLVGITIPRAACLPSSASDHFG